MKTIFFVLPGLLSISLAFARQTESSVLSVYLQKAQYRQAIEYIDRQEATKDLLYQKPFCYQSLNNFSATIEILNFLSAESPDDIPVKLQLALCYESIFLLFERHCLLRRFNKADSANAYFQVRRADFLYRSEQYLRAIIAWKLDKYMQILQEQTAASKTIINN
jgi:hypothetical protein